MHLRKIAMAVLLLGLAACGTTQTAYTPPWLVGQAGPPFPYNSSYCP